MLNTWLEDLSSSVKKAQARKDGKSIDAEEASHTLADLLDEAVKNDNAVWIIGNGGSSSIISHMAQDFMGKLGLRSQALTDASMLTCTANDFGYEKVYSRPLGIMGRKNDILIAISSGGNSENIVNAVNKASEINMNIVTLSGFKDTNKLFNQSNGLNFYIPSENYGTVEVAHLAVLHTVLDHMVELKNSNQSQNKISAL